MAVLEIEPARGMVNVSATSADKGEVSQDIIVDFSQGDDKTQEVLRLGINARYLSDAIKSLSGEGSILLGFKGETRPVQIQWCDSVAVIMPMRLKGN